METRWRQLGDDLGPAKVVLIRNPEVGLQGMVVVDNVACGPAIGGIRMALDVTVSEVARLARAMTFKNAAAGLAHGGGKGGIIADPQMNPSLKERVIRSFGRAIKNLLEYIPGPERALPCRDSARSARMLHDFLPSGEQFWLRRRIAVVP